LVVRVDNTIEVGSGNRVGMLTTVKAAKRRRAMVTACQTPAISVKRIKRWTSVSSD
jgi:hypothetical protein